MKKWNVASVRAAKGVRKLGCCTAYDACFARLADAAGVPILAEQDYETRINPCAPVDADYSVTVRGDSMAPTYLDGDVVFIREQPEVDDGCVAVVLIDDSAAVKHVVRAKDGLLLISDNPNYPPMLMRWAEHEHMRVLGLVTGYLRMYRTDPLRGVQKGFA